MPEASDYPKCLEYLLYRKTWISTLGQLQVSLYSEDAEPVFFKPASDIKAFSGEKASPGETGMLEFFLDEFSESFPIICSTAIEMISEYRVYVVNGVVRSVCHYKGPKDVLLDLDVVQKAVKTLTESDEGKDLVGCALDFALMRNKDSDTLLTGLVEVNDGFSIGAYDGISEKDYTEVLIARW